MKASEIMTKEVITVKPSMNLQDLAKLFIDKNISGTPVVDGNNKYIGLITDADLVIHDKKVHLPTYISFLSGFFILGEKQFEEEMKKIAAITVEGLMKKDAKTISPGTQVEEVATIMTENHVFFLPVIENGELKGVVTKRDFVKAISLNKL